ncbi:hypothetical protein F2Q69_00011441 [Brassica cretica]|uniref:Cystatin domain-containing protein n=2 Tax=Brassica TaxID=3705 RepID=A0A8S9R5Q3_BRACR|nr:hypothetical protein F2Q69_00011441 [Brassica cretica]VDD06872.1 unnamed protein product [Brassica oleracea]
MNKSIFFVLFSLILLSVHVFGLTPLEDQWIPIKDVKDPYIIEIGEFAVSEYARLNKLQLKFVTVVSGDIQIASNLKYYKLIVTANDGGNSASKNYETVVWKLKSISELMDFEPLS